MDNTEKEYCPVTYKVCYSARKAQEVITKTKKYQGRGRRKSIPKRTYKCQYCGYFHLTHLSSKQTCKSTLNHIKY